ncbi:peptidoglycan-binding protein [Rhizobium sp. SGZ-381]|uniref:peptidoglycan-binding protein n=1 Tax=Rhizobium sp. SGZ-381 TaxID=3342800 RepID=UPI00366C0DC0
MNGSRLTINARGERSSLDALNRTIEGLEARIEGLLKASAPREPQKPAPAPAPMPTMAPREPALRAPTGEPPHRPHADALAEIRERQRMLDAARERRTAAGDAAPRLGAAPARPGEGPGVIAPRRPAPARALDALSPRDSEPTGNAGTGTIAEALHELRRELRQDISDNIAREMQSLRDDVQSMRGFADGRDLGSDLRDELARLADGIDMLSSRTPSAATDLRAELDDLRAQIDGLARQDSLHSMETRWSAVEERLEEFDAGSIQKELVALAYRIDGVKAELATMADSPAIRTLEDKVLMLAAVVEDLAQRPLESEHVSGQFSHIDHRLDELSRAVAANNSRPRNEAAEHEALRRLEERLIALNDRIESLAHVQDAYRLEERLEELAEFFARGPQQEIASSLSDLTARIETLASDHASDGLARRLEDLTRRIDGLGTAAAGSPAGLGRLEIRLDEIAARLEEATLAPQGDNLSLLGLEKQIAHLSSLMSEPRRETTSLPEDFDQRMAAIEGYMATSDEYVLEAARQAAETVIEAYSRHGARGSGNETSKETETLLALAQDLRQLEDLARGSEERTQQTFSSLQRTLVEISGRLDRMEDRMSERPTALFGGAPLAPARAETESTLRPPMAQPAAPMRSPVDAGDPRGMLARASEQLMAETAASPALKAQDAEPAPMTDEDEARRPGLLASLSKRLRARRGSAGKTGRTRVEPAPSLDPGSAVAADEDEGNHDNDLLEPGSGAPDVRKILERVRATQAAADAEAERSSTQPASGDGDGERVDYIAAARRAAKAAALEMGQAPTDGSRAYAGSGVSGGRATFARHRRPILIAVGAVLLALMAMPLFTALTKNAPSPAPSMTTGEATRPAKTSAPTQGIAAAAPQKPAIPAAAETSAAASPAPSGAAPGTASVQAAAPQVINAAEAPAVEPAPVQATAQLTAPATTELPALEPAPQAPVARHLLPAEAAAAMDSTTEAAIIVPAGLAPQSLADAAAGGNRQALFEIAVRLGDGEGVAPNPAEAARFYGLAAQRGYAPAQYRLASLYEKGTGVPRDPARAVSLYEQAANAGNAGAMHNLAVLYASGATGSADYKAAVEWFGRAADLGVTDSQFNLAILFARGNGTVQNLEESYKWFAIAANGGDRDAAAKRDDVASAMKPAQLESARQKVASWKQQPLDPEANGTQPPADWAARAEASAPVDMEKAVRNIQAILNRNGFDAGQPDGRMGKKTVSAIRAFQRSNGLAEDGTISEALVRKLLEKNKVQGA